MTKQCERIMTHLTEHGSITSLEAMNLLGIYRLASRICDLRKKEGIGIVSKMESSKNRYGETVRYKRYYLEDENGI